MLLTKHTPANKWQKPSANAKRGTWDLHWKLGVCANGTVLIPMTRLPSSSSLLLFSMHNSSERCYRYYCYYYHFHWFHNFPPFHKQTELSQNLQQLSEKARSTTEFIQRLKGMSDKVTVIIIYTASANEIGLLSTQIVGHFAILSPRAPLQCVSISRRSIPSDTRYFPILLIIPDFLDIFQIFFSTRTGIVPRIRTIDYNAMWWPNANDSGATRLFAGNHWNG